MLFAVFALDRSDIDTKPLRERHKHAHVDYFSALKGEVFLSGTLQDRRDHTDPGGTLIIIEADSQTAAEEFIAGDPFVKAGIFSQIAVRPFAPEHGRWLPPL